MIYIGKNYFKKMYHSLLRIGDKMSQITDTLQNYVTAIDEQTNRIAAI